MSKAPLPNQHLPAKQPKPLTESDAPFAYIDCESDDLAAVMMLPNHSTTVFAAYGNPSIRHSDEQAGEKILGAELEQRVTLLRQMGFPAVFAGGSDNHDSCDSDFTPETRPLFLEKSDAVDFTPETRPLFLEKSDAECSMSNQSDDNAKTHLESNYLASYAA